jgi:hypothetical protein
MAKYVIVPIVEGHGEVRSVPILVKNWLRFRRYRNVEVHVDGPVRAKGKQSLTVDPDRTRALGIEHYAEIANLRDPDAILVILDADDNPCPGALASSLLERAKAVLPDDLPVSVVVANREYSEAAQGTPIALDSGKASSLEIETRCHNAALHTINLTLPSLASTLHYKLQSYKDRRVLGS